MGGTRGTSQITGSSTVEGHGRVPHPFALFAKGWGFFCGVEGNLLFLTERRPLRESKAPVVNRGLAIASWYAVYQAFTIAEAENQVERSAEGDGVEP